MPALLSGCIAGDAGRLAVAAALDRHAAVRDTAATSYAEVPPSRPVDPDSEPPQGPAPLAAPATLREFIVAALQHNPAIRSAEQTAMARAERVPQATALPDPMVSTKTLVEPIRTAEGDNYFVLGVSQKLPVPEQLDRAGRVALAETRVALEALEEVRLRVIADVKRAYFQLYIIDRSIEVTEENQKLLRGLIDAARAQVAAGRRPQDDVLRAQVELSNLEAELVRLRQRRVTTAERLNELLDRDPGAAIPTPEDFSLRDADLSVESLLTRARLRNPALARLREQIEREAQSLELARLARWPDFTLGFEWINMEPRDAFVPQINPQTGRRPRFSRMSEEGTDNWAITLGFNLPIWFDRIEAGIQEARHRWQAAQDQYEAAENRVQFEVRDALERVRAQQTLARLFHNTIIPQADQAYQVSQASYIGGRADFLDVIDNWRKWLVFTIQYYRSLGELERSVADLEQAIGMSLSELETP